MPSVPSVPTWSDDVVATDTLMNANIRDPQSFLLGLPAFCGWNTVAASIPTSAYTPIPINVEDVNVGFTHATDDTKVYATYPGWYRVNFTVSYQSGTTAGASGQRGAWVAKNGATVFRVPSGPWHGAAFSATQETIVGGRTGMVYLNGTTDYVEVVGFQNGTGLTLSTFVTSTTSGTRTGISILWQGRDA